MTENMLKLHFFAPKFVFLKYLCDICSCQNVIFLKNQPFKKDLVSFPRDKPADKLINNLYTSIINQLTPSQHESQYM